MYTTMKLEPSFTVLETSSSSVSLHIIARCALFSTNVSLNAIDLSKYDTMEPDIIIKTKKVDGMIVNSE